MKVGDGKTESGRGLEPAGWGVHANRWGRKRVVWGENEGAPVLAMMVRCIFRSRENIMPPERSVLVSIVTRG